MSSIEDLLKHDDSAKPAQPGGAIKVPAQSDAGAVLARKMQDMSEREHEDEVKKKAEELGLGYVNLKGIAIPPDILRQLSEEFVFAEKTICFYLAPHNVVRLAIAEDNIQQLEEVKKKLPENFGKINNEWFLTSTVSFEAARKLYDALPKIKEVSRGVEITEADIASVSSSINSLSDIAQKLKDVPLTQMVALIIAAGVKIKASDIHIECEVDGVKLRYRIDGVLHTAATLESSIWQQLISRLKLLAELKLNISDKPQDGRFSIFLVGDKIDVRVSTLPTNYGESVVMRLLMAKSVSLKFADLGLRPALEKILRREIGRPNGMVITTGPTGSGKTTTLYAILNELNNSETKIITIEDPIEYELQGINQSQIDENADYTFAKGLRSIVRQDPDVLMVGEMRDLETVDIALNAALTGHLVLSTLHTNDAAGAIPRFLAMGAKPYLLAPALNLIIAQRLVRRLCQKCKKEIELEPGIKQKVMEILKEIGNQKAEIREINFDNLEQIKFFTAVGCEECSQIGYRGQIGIYEMFNMTSEIEQVILSNEISEYKIRDLAKSAGMISLVADGLIKATEGITSVEEVFRVAE
ncbi:MAG: GspE/PulE family protein [Patescibacteria group bacterium]|nr:GspE/PulE family protein [Patescibacteria group bacterium]